MNVDRHGMLRDGRWVQPVSAVGVQRHQRQRRAALMTADQPLLDAALAYATRGFRVLPLHHPIQAGGRRQPGGVGCSCGDPGCGPVGKHPRTPHGLHMSVGHSVSSATEVEGRWMTRRSVRPRRGS